MNRNEFIQQYVLNHGSEPCVLETAKRLAESLMDENVIDAYSEVLDTPFANDIRDRRVKFALGYREVTTIRDLLKVGRNTMLNTPRVGKRSIHILDEYLKSRNVEW